MNEEPLKVFGQAGSMIGGDFWEINLVPFCRMDWIWERKKMGSLVGRLLK